MEFGKVDVGDRVSVVLKDHSEEGRLMPSTDSDIIMIKLDNGYNVGFENCDVLKVELLSKAKHAPKEENVVSKNSKLPTIAILHTGGTIASKIDYKTGGVVAKISANDLVEMVPELAEFCNIESKTIFNMMSEDMSPHEYGVLADAICAEASKGVKGIIIGHGTDTLSMSSAVISFMIKILNIPVVFVGSQRSSDRGSSDAAMNLICAAKFIASSDAAGVYLCMHENSDDTSCVILPGTKTRKMHTSRRDAFKAINSKIVARVLYPSGEVEILDNDYVKADSVKEELELKGGLSSEVALVKTYTGMKSSVFDYYTDSGYKGMILEGTGIGHAPTNSAANEGNYLALKRFIDNGGVVGITSSCLYGTVHEHIYSNTRRLGKIGVVFCSDMFSETAFMKLMWLLGNYSAPEAKKMLALNLRGEISSKLAYSEKFSPDN